MDKKEQVEVGFNTFVEPCGVEINRPFCGFRGFQNFKSAQLESILHWMCKKSGCTLNDYFGEMRLKEIKKEKYQMEVKSASIKGEERGLKASLDKEVK